MELKLKLFLICICLFFMLFIYKKIEKGDLFLKYSFVWYLTLILLIFITIFDHILEPLKNFLGFVTVSNMVFTVGFLLLAMLIFSTYTKISELTAKNVKLTQEVALLKKELENELPKKRHK